MLEVTWPQVLAFWLQRHFLEERAGPGELTAVVRRVGGLHAQVMSSAELAAWARIEGLDSDAVPAALWQERTLVKSWAMRWTLHLLPAADYPLYLAAFGASRYFERESWLKSVGISAADMNALLEGFRVTLSGEGMTREQLADALAERSGRAHLREKLLRGWGTLLKPGTYQGHLLFGPNDGRNVTFVSPRQWLGELPERDTGEAQREMVRRYLAAYGPATHGDFASWWGMPKRDARRIFGALGDELIPVDVEGREAWALRDDAATLQAIAPSSAVRLLPRFDPYTVGLRRDVEAALPATHKRRVYSLQGWIWAVVLSGGSVVGTWNHEVRKGRVAVTVEPFAPLSPAVRAGIEEEAARLGGYLGAEAEVSIAG